MKRENFYLRWMKQGKLNERKKGSLYWKCQSSNENNESATPSRHKIARKI